MRDNHQVRDLGCLVIPQIPSRFPQGLEDNMLIIIEDNDVGHHLCLTVDMVTIEVTQQFRRDIVREDGVEAMSVKVFCEITRISGDVLTKEHGLFFLTPKTLILPEGGRDGRRLSGLTGKHGIMWLRVVCECGALSNCLIVCC